jgi:hypothetical protein
VQAVSLHTQPSPLLRNLVLPLCAFYPPLPTPYQVEGHIRIFTPTLEGKYVYKKSGEFIFLFFYMASFYVPLLIFHSRQPVFQDRMIKALH